MAVSAASSSSSRVSSAPSSARSASTTAKSSDSTSKTTAPSKTSSSTAQETADRFEKAAQRSSEQKVALQPVKAASALLMNALVLGTGVDSTMTMGDPLNPTRPYSGAVPTRVLKKGL